MTVIKPHSTSSVENREPILAVLQPLFANVGRVLEIGSGTGQHAIFFAAALPHLIWQTSELEDNLAGIQLWLDEAALPNTPPPLQLDVSHIWPDALFDAAFTANTAHIMSIVDVAMMFCGIGAVLNPGGLFVQYGPFNEGGQFTSASNQAFDASLRERDPRMGLRDVDELQVIAARHDLTLLVKHQMPVNNQILVWQRA